MKYPETPWLASLKRAAAIANMDPDDIRFEIHYYAKRNRLVHSNVKAMINSARFGALAEQILADKRRLGQIYGDNRRSLDYRLAIDRLEGEWFDKPSFIGNDGVVHFMPNAKAQAKTNSFFDT